MTRAAWIVAHACALAAGAAAHGQFIGPLPPKGEPEPAPGSGGTPMPSEPPPKDLSSADTEPPAPSIVDKDQTGALRVLERGAEDEALARYAFSAERLGKVQRSLANRRLEIDRFVIQKLDTVLALEGMRERVLNTTEFGPLFEAREHVAAVRFERVLDRLQRDGAISALQRARLDQSVREYEKALRDHFEAQTGGDPTRQAVLNLRQTYLDATREPLESLGRLLTDVQREAATLPTGPGAPLDARQRDALIAAAGKADPNERAASVRAVFDTLSPEQKRAVLSHALARRSGNP